ncbi:hypothetical protein D8Y22_07525 [Salinadaptatus halalkaliphilus]|uniref:Uncharacterized protein n=1 Tax=Salinadaptatus halalkaliphilus TaxID=2419781 RepID=A0A4S3TMH3_9EURY|nr:hypothetical protein [Salinadaptatus halalkaliphilus]THE65441.1 hypothetical protein D8Y22_07525 [Salinadaptatus halalkaliphilus]
MEDVVDADDIEAIQWRHDASTSTFVRWGWALGVGTFFAAISIVVWWRLYDLASQTGVETVVFALTAAAVVTILALAIGDTNRHLRTLAGWLSLEPTDRTLERAMDATLGTVAMALVIGSFMVAGRLVVELDVLENVGPGPFTGVAALTLPVALVVLVLASFFSSRGALDRTNDTLYLGDPDHAIDLELIQAVSVRRIGDAAVVGLTYAQPDNQYVAGPRRIVVPPDVASEIERTVNSRP